MAEILGRYWQLLHRSGKKIILLSPLFMPNSWRHTPSPSPRIQLNHVTTYASRHYVTTETALRVFHFFTALFSWVTNKNLRHDHCSSICNALMMVSVVIETLAICRLYRFHWPWFSLWDLWLFLEIKKSRKIMPFSVRKTWLWKNIAWPAYSLQISSKKSL